MALGAEEWIERRRGDANVLNGCALLFAMLRSPKFPLGAAKDKLNSL